MNNPNAPSSSMVTVGHNPETGETSASVSKQGGQSLNTVSPYAQALAVAMSNVEPIRNRAQFFLDRVNARSNTIDPKTGQAKYLHSQEERERSARGYNQLLDSIAYQEAQAHDQAARAQAAADEDRAILQANVEHNEAVRKRAYQIAAENEAKSLASRLSIRAR